MSDFEKGTEYLVENGDFKTQAIISAAISLKRIADALQEPNEYGEIGGAAIAGSVRRGLMK